MWLGLLSRFWPYLLGVAAILSAALWLHHRGYESGFAASEEKWQPLFAKAERELAAANARTEMKEAESNRAVAESQRRIDETQKDLHDRSVDYDSRLRALSLRYTAAAARRCDVPQAPGTPGSPDTASRINERAERAGAGFADIGGRAERDAARLAECVRVYTEQRAIINQ